MTTKNITKLLAITASILMTVAVFLPYQTIAFGQSTECTPQILDSLMHAKARTMDNAKAFTMATSLNEFKTRIHGYVLADRSIFDTWSNDVKNCVVNIETVNVAQQLNDSKGYVKTVVVTLDPALSKVIGVSEQVGARYSTNNYWSGYDLPGPSSTPTVYQAQLLNSLTAVGSPVNSKYSSPCSTSSGNPPCDLAIWTGLENSPGAGGTYTNGPLAQAGSDGKITCSTPSSCTTYFLWYEFLPSSAYNCYPSSGKLNTGDPITTIVTNDYIPTGNSNQYDISVQDGITGFSCSTTAYTYNSMTAPQYAAYINERATYPGYPTSTLASFSSDKMTGWMYYGSGTHQITSSNGYVNEYMNNGCTHNNISYGSISSGAFTQSYYDSCGT